MVALKLSAAPALLADLFYIKDDVSFAPLHSDPRWDAFLRKLEPE